MKEILFTPASVLSLLVQIDELQDKEIGLTETVDNNIQLQIGDSTYEIIPDGAVDVETSESDLSEVSDANIKTYEELADDGEIELEDDSVDLNTPVEGGILKEIAKTLLVGGIVRLGSKLLSNDKDKR